MMQGPRIRPLVLVLTLAVCVPALHLSAQSADVPTSIDPLLDGSSLNDVWLHINAQDWRDLHATYQTNTYYPVDFEWNGQRVRNAGIRVKGSSTRNPQKPSFRIDFNRYVTDQQFLGQNAVVLNSSWLDPSNIHDRVSMALFRRMGIPAPRQANIRLFVGAAREYAGVYAISEEVSKAFLNTHFGNDDGYLFAFNHTEDGTYWYFEDPGPGYAWFPPRFSPKTHETDPIPNLYQPMEDLIQAVNDAPQSDLESKLSDFLDLDTFITEIAVQNFLSQTDGLVGNAGMNNFFLYRFPHSRRWTFIPWDQDQSFAQLDEPPSWNMAPNVLAKKIWNEPKYRDRYLSMIMAIGSSVSAPAGADASSGWLEQEVLNDAAQIRNAVYQDPLKQYSNDEFEQSVALMQQFGRQREAYERAFVAQVAPELVNVSGTSRFPSLRVRTSR
jgi:spore coat protein H